MHRIIKILAITFGVLFLGNTAVAAELFFYTPQKIKTVSVEADDSIGVYINTQKQTVNAVEGEINVLGDVEVLGVSLGNSIVPLWIEEPKVIAPSTVHFAGIIPGGLEHFSGLLFKLIVKYERVGIADLRVNAFTALLHDGVGTIAATSSKDLQLQILDTPPVFQETARTDDVTPPEYFKIEIMSDSNLFAGDWVAIFQTQDKGLGIDYYEVQETRYKNLNKQGWKKATSPYVLLDQSLRSYIYVKAVDRAGNIYIDVVSPQYPLTWWEDYHNWFILLLGGLFPFIYIFILLKKILKYKKSV